MQQTNPQIRHLIHPTMLILHTEAAALLE